MPSPFDGPYSFSNGACAVGHPVNQFGRCEVLNTTGKCEPPTPPWTVDNLSYACLSDIKVITADEVQDHLNRKHVIVLGVVRANDQNPS